MDNKKTQLSVAELFFCIFGLHFFILHFFFVDAFWHRGNFDERSFLVERRFDFMYAFIRLGGHQHRVEKDMIFLTEKIGRNAGDEFVCSEVLFIGQEKGQEKGSAEVKAGTPVLEGAKVTLKVLEEIRAPKILGFKYKKRKGYRRRWGHRQNLHKLKVLSVEA